VAPVHGAAVRGGACCLANQKKAPRGGLGEKTGVFKGKKKKGNAPKENKRRKGLEGEIANKCSQNRNQELLRKIYKSEKPKSKIPLEVRRMLPTLRSGDPFSKGRTGTCSLGRLIRPKGQRGGEVKKRTRTKITRTDFFRNKGAC